MARVNKRAMEIGGRVVEADQSKAEPPVEVRVRNLDERAGVDEELAGAEEVMGIVGEDHRWALSVSTLV